MEVAAGASSTRETRQPGNSTRAGGPEETAAQYAVIAIVPIFCLMGLLGILVCNLLKRKGYHCTAHKEVGPGPGAGGSGEARPGVLVGRPEGTASQPSPAQRPPKGTCVTWRVCLGEACRGQIGRGSWRCRVPATEGDTAN